MAPSISKGDPKRTEVVIVGNGPSSLILSYILHGHIPYYDLDHPHPDPLLHKKLTEAGKHNAPLLPSDVSEVARLTEHFPASNLSYSSQALPVNALLDALRRPAGEDEIANAQGSCIRWQHHPDLAVPHLVIGDAKNAGGQWSTCPRGTSEDVQSLSYAGQLSLPGYSLFDHVTDEKATGKTRHGADSERTQPGNYNLAFYRPKRHEVADYLASYPSAVGIADTLLCGQRAKGIGRDGDLFYITSHNLTCRYLVLATGTLTEDIPPPEPLEQLASLALPDQTADRVDTDPMLVIGSGFSAADTIISASPTQRIIHVFRWDPIHDPSPLAAGHSAVYPMSSAIYRLMRAAASGSKIHVKETAKDSPMISFLRSRNWGQIYEGIPNATVTSVESETDDSSSSYSKRYATVTISLEDGSMMSQRVSCLVYAVGRMGKLDYLTESLYEEVVGRDCESPTSSSILSQVSDTSIISGLGEGKDSKYVTGSTLRERALRNLEVAPRVFIVGSLAGDSLVRYADGSCAYVAGRIGSCRKARPTTRGDCR